MKLTDDSLVLLEFARYLANLCDTLDALRWKGDDGEPDRCWDEEEANRWGFNALREIAEGESLIEEEGDRERLLLALPAWAMACFQEFSALDLLATAIGRMTSDASSFERTVLMDGDSLPDVEGMFERVRDYLSESAVLNADGPEFADEIREELTGLSILPALAAFAQVWRLADEPHVVAISFAVEGMTIFATEE